MFVPWDYSIAGLVTLSKDGREAVTNALNELKKYCFLTIEAKRTNKGAFSTFYTFYENPEENPNYKGLTATGFPLRSEKTEENIRNGFSVTVNPMQTNRNGSTDSEKSEQININNNNLKQITKTEKKKKQKEKISFGEFNNVFLTQDEIGKLKELYKNEEKFNEGIAILSNYKESSGRKYKSDYAVLNRSNWVFQKVFPKNEQLSLSEFENEGKYSRCYG